PEEEIEEKEERSESSPRASQIITTGPVPVPTPLANFLFIACNGSTFSPGSKVEGIVVLVIQSKRTNTALTKSDEDRIHPKELKLQFTGEAAQRFVC